MPKVTVYDMTGKQTGEMELSDSVFGIEVNKSAMHQAVVNYLANQRAGTQSALTRAEVSGGGRKPWRQKGTGRARHGSTRSPQWTHGGVAFAPKPRSYRTSLNKKLRRLALKSAFSSKVLEGKLIVVDELTMDEIKTRTMYQTLKALGMDKKALIVTDGPNENVYKSARNIPGVKASPVNSINVYDILKYDLFILSKDAVATIEEVYAS